MKQGWELIQLGDVCGFQNGFAFKSKTFKETGFPVLRISNIQKDKIDLNKIVFIDPSDYKEDLSKYKVEKNDLLIAMSGATTGKIGFNQTDDIFYLNQRVGKFEPTKDLDKSYLYYYLSTKVEESLKISAGSAQPNLSTQQIKSFELPFPPLDEQKRIVSKLDECFEAIDTARANVEKNLNNAKELFQSQLNQIFSQKGDGWVEKKLGDVAEVIAGQSPKGKYYNDKGDGLPFYQGKKLFGEKHLNEPNIWTSVITKESYAGDIVMSVRAPVGDVNFNYHEKICIGRGLAAIRAGKTVNKDYLFYFLVHHKNEIVGNTGAVFNSINKTQISNIIIPMVDLAKQNAIVKELDELKSQTQSLESNYQQELDALDELKKSILQKAFNGEL